MDFYRINEDYNRYLQNYEKEIKGSLRFNYMIPVPEECIERLIIKDVEDEKYRLLLNKEYQFCMDNAERIQKKANKIYEMVTTNRKQKLTDNSCAFSILEQGYREYIENVLRKKPPGPPIPEKLWLTRFRDWSSIFFAPGTLLIKNFHE